jgi:hypothetical protein
MASEPRSITSRSQPWRVIQRIVFSEAVLNVCYWCTVVLVAVVGAFVFHWRWTHPMISLVEDDPWGISTPPWIVEALFPVLMFGSLVQACQQALCGYRQWKFVGTATLVMAVAGLSETLQAFTAAK